MTCHNRKWRQLTFCLVSLVGSYRQEDKTTCGCCNSRVLFCPLQICNLPWFNEAKDVHEWTYSPLCVFLASCAVCLWLGCVLPPHLWPRLSHHTSRWMSLAGPALRLLFSLLLLAGVQGVPWIYGKAAAAESFMVNLLWAKVHRKGFSFFGWNSTRYVDQHKSRYFSDKTLFLNIYWNLFSKCKCFRL